MPEQIYETEICEWQYVCWTKDKVSSFCYFLKKIKHEIIEIVCSIKKNFVWQLIFSLMGIGSNVLLIWGVSQNGISQSTTSFVLLCGWYWTEEGN